MGCPYHFLPRMPGHANRTSKDQTGWTRIAWKKNFMVCLLVVREHRGILQRHPKSTGKLACDWKANGSHHLEPTQWAALLPAPPQKSTKHGLIIDCFQRFAIKKKTYFPHKWRHKQELDVVKVGKEPSTALIRCRFVFSPGFWDKSLIPKVKYNNVGSGMKK